MISFWPAVTGGGHGGLRVSKLGKLQDRVSFHVFSGDVNACGCLARAKYNVQ